jgi:hypothetical protein
MVHLPGVGAMSDKLLTPRHYVEALWHLKSRPPFTRDHALIERFAATLRKIEWGRSCRGR